jgi:hypothetical protein
VLSGVSRQGVEDVLRALVKVIAREKDAGGEEAATEAWHP